MKIVTVNIPESYLDAINKLIGEKGIYPSRSELIRVATREFLIKELKMVKNLPKYDKIEEEAYDKQKFVRVPIVDNNSKKPNGEFKTYRIVKRLEF